MALPPAPVAAAPAATRFADYKELLKPGISLFVVVTAAAGYLLGAQGTLDGSVLFALLAGTALTAGGSGALNHLLERTHDRRMKRTMNRPLPQRRIAPKAVLAYGIALNLLGLVLLSVYTNLLTAGLALATSLLYLFVYTPLKRVTPLNTLVGAVPGALPAFGGFVAATNGFGAGGWAIFAVLFLWQLPHFFSLAWLYRDDYRRGGFKMLPVVEPTGVATSRSALVAALLLLVASVMPTVLGLTGSLYLFGMMLLGTWFTIPAFAFHAEPTAPRARRLLLASIVYLPIFCGLVFLDALFL